jgi:WD40 repeat protein
MPGIDHALLSFNADGARLAAVGPDGTVVIIDTTGGGLVEAARLPDGRQFHAVAFSPDGALLAAAGPQGVVVWETSGWTAVLSLDSPVTAISFVGPRALAYSDGSQVVVRDLDSGAERQFAGPDDLWGQTVLLSAGPALSSVPAGPSFDAGTLAAVSAAGVVRLWDVGSAVRWDAAPNAPVPATALRLHPDGRSLTVAGASVTTWTIDPDYWLEWLCDVTRRNLTAAEWQTYGAGERPIVCPQYPVD